VSAKERVEFLPIITTIPCPRCGAQPGEACTYKNNARRKGNNSHDARFVALKKSKSTRPVYSKYGNVPGHNYEDLRPIASRRLTLREMRDAGIWVPLKEEKK
jgi:hypothetical protein